MCNKTIKNSIDFYKVLYSQNWNVFCTLISLFIQNKLDLSLSITMCFYFLLIVIINASATNLLVEPMLKSRKNNE